MTNSRTAAVAFAAGALWHITSCTRAIVGPFAYANNLGSIAHPL